MKYYIFKKNFSLKGFLTEPVYDHAPDVESYTKEIRMYFHEGDIISIDNQGEINIDSSPYGVSIWGSEVKITDKLNLLLKDKCIVEISEQQVATLETMLEEICKLQENLTETCTRCNYYDDAVNDIVSEAGLSKDDYEKASSDIYEATSQWFAALVETNKLEKKIEHLHHRFKEALAIA